MMKRIAEKTGKALIMTVFVAALSLAAVPVMAQSGYGNAAQQQNFDEPTLQKFAMAAVELGKIQTKFSQKLQSVQDPEEATTIQQKMGKEMIVAVQDEGIDVETYNAIANQMNADPKMRSEVEQMIQEINN